MPGWLVTLQKLAEIAPPNFKFNPWHDELGRFTTGPSSDVQPVSDTAYATPGGLKYGEKIKTQMQQRGWTESSIDEAKEYGWGVPATNKYNGNPAVRYISPTNGQSVVVDQVTNQIVQVQGAGFRQGPGSGDVEGGRPIPPANRSPNINPGPPPVIEAPLTDAPATPELPDIIPSIIE